MKMFRNLLAAEWIKMRSLRSMRWGVLAGMLGVLWMNVNAALADYGNYHAGDQHRSIDGKHEIFTNNAHMVALIVFGVLGAIVMVGEYSTGLVRGTFAAVPDRRAVVAAKVVMTTAVATAVGVVMIASSYAVTQLIIGGKYGYLSPLHDGVPRMLAASVLLVPVAALVGLGLGALIRHSASTAVGVVLLLVMLPNVVFSRIHAWINDLHNAMPFSAWQRLVDGDAGPPQPGTFAQPGVGGSWLVYALWAGVAVALAFVLVERRDV